MFIEVFREGHHHLREDMETSSRSDDEFRLDARTIAINTSCTQNPPVSLSVGRIEPIVGMKGTKGCSWDASSMQYEEAHGTAQQ